MPSLNMKGPYPLKEEYIDTYVEETIGNYALGFSVNDIFVVQYVGRSDTNLNQRLKDHVGENGYTHFEFIYSDDSGSAYKKECVDYHAYLNYKLNNDIHPQKPKDGPALLTCPVCSQ